MKYSIEKIHINVLHTHRWIMLKATESKRIWNWLIARIASFLNWQCSVTLVLLSFALFLFQFCILNDDSLTFYAPTCACMLKKKTASCNLSSCAGYLGKALTKTLVTMSDTTGHLCPQCSSLSSTKWTLCMLQVVFSHFLCYKKTTSVISAVRTGTRKTACKWEKLKFLSAVVVWNGAATVMNTYRGVYNSIVLSFSDCRKSKRPVLKTFDLSRSLFYCTVLYKNAECFSFRSFFVCIYVFTALFLVQTYPRRTYSWI